MASGYLLYEMITNIFKTTEKFYSICTESSFFIQHSSECEISDNSQKVKLSMCPDASEFT